MTTATDQRPLPLIEVTRIQDAQFLYCPDCDTYYDDINVPWGLRQIQAMHKRGTGHKVTLWQIGPVR